MKATRKETKQSSLIHQRIRKASFIPLGSHDTEKFKYYVVFKFNKYLDDKFIVLKNICNRIIQKIQLWVQKVDFIAIRDDISLWLIEVLIEGFLINYIVWALIGWKFNLITMLAWGFAIKQSLSFYWRLKKDGSHATIPTKNE